MAGNSVYKEAQLNTATDVMGLTVESKFSVQWASCGGKRGGLEAQWYCPLEKRKQNFCHDWEDRDIETEIGQGTYSSIENMRGEDRNGCSRKSGFDCLTIITQCHHITQQWAAFMMTAAMLNSIFAYNGYRKYYVCRAYREWRRESKNEKQLWRKLWANRRPQEQLLQKFLLCLCTLSR